MLNVQIGKMGGKRRERDKREDAFLYEAAGWRAALARVLRGQTGFDIVGPAGG